MSRDLNSPGISNRFEHGSMKELLLSSTFTVASLSYYNHVPEVCFGLVCQHEYWFLMYKRIYLGTDSGSIGKELLGLTSVYSL